MKNQLKIFLLSLLFGVALPLAALAKPSYVVAGYATYDVLSSYPVTTAFPNPVNDGTQGGIPWADLSHVNFGFVTIGGTTAYMYDPAGMVPALIANAHANGVRCYLTVGGSTPAAQWSGITSNAAASALASSVATLMVQNQGAPVTFDGVDVDCEFPGMTNFPNTAVFSTFVQDLRTDLNALSPGLAPSGSYSGESNVGLTMYLSPGSAVCGYNFTTLNSYVDWYMLSGYDMNDQVPGDAWNAALNDTTTIGTCIPSTVTDDIVHMAAWYNTNDGGIPYTKMILGMPFFGANSGGTAWVADNNIFTAGTAGAYNSGTAECIYNGTYSMDTAQSFCDKMNWAIGSKGMKGIGIWDLTDGLPVTANAMMTNIWNTIAGTSCVTISTPCPACTNTPTPVPLPPCGVLVDNFENGSYFSAMGFSDTASYGGTCGTTANPINGNGWYPSIGYGLNGSQLGGRMWGTLGTTSTGCWGPTLLLGLGGYNASAENAFRFTIRVDGGNTSGGTTFVVGTLNTATQYQYNYLLTIPTADVGTETSAAASVVSSQWGTQIAVTVYFSQLTPNGTGEPVFSAASLYDLFFEPVNPTAGGTWTGNYDYTVDDIYFLCAPTPTPTPTNTNTFTATKTFTPTNTMTPTFTSTNTPTPTLTFTPTVTNTNTFTVTPTFTLSYTNTPTNSFTNTPANTNTFTSTSTFTDTFTNTPTKTFTPTNSFTNTGTSTYTPTNTGTPTNTNTGTQPPTNTFTNTPANTSTFTSTNTPTPTNSFTGTSTPTSPFTATFTFTPTNTGTSTNTRTSTFTRTNTATFTSTNTPTATFTFTNTSTSTATPSSTFTPTNTFTATQPAVQVGPGSSPPSNQTVGQGATNVPVLQVSVTNQSGETVQLTGVTLTATGTGVSSSGVSSLSVYAIVGGTPTLVGTVTSPFALSSTLSYSLPGGVNLPASSSATFLVTYNLSPTAAPGTYTASLANAGALTGTGLTSGKGIQVNGTPLNGAVITVTANTATPTATAPFTPTSTVTPTATATSLVTQITISQPYPNPVSGPNGVSLNITAPAASKVSWAVFTTSYRKVWDDSMPVPAGRSAIHWNLRDKDGVPVSDGLYYIRVQVSGLNSTTHIFKVLVLQ